MDNLVKYYVRQAGGGGGGDNGVGPIYVVPPFVQRGHGIGSFLSGLFRAVRPILWSGAKLLGKEALRTGGKILTGIVDNPNVGASKIISRNVTESLKNLRAKMSGQGQRKRKRGGPHHATVSALNVRPPGPRKEKGPPRLQNVTSFPKAY